MVRLLSRLYAWLLRASTECPFFSIILIAIGILTIKYGIDRFQGGDQGWGVFYVLLGITGIVGAVTNLCQICFPKKTGAGKSEIQPDPIMGKQRPVIFDKQIGKKLPDHASDYGLPISSEGAKAYKTIVEEAISTTTTVKIGDWKTLGECEFLDIRKQCIDCERWCLDNHLPAYKNKNHRIY